MTVPEDIKRIIYPKYSRPTKLSDPGSERLFDIRPCGVRILHRIVEHGGGDDGLVLRQASNDGHHLHRMKDIGPVLALPLCARVSVHGKQDRFLDRRHLSSLLSVRCIFLRQMKRLSARAVTSGSETGFFSLTVFRH